MSEWIPVNEKLPANDVPVLVMLNTVPRSWRFINHRMFLAILTDSHGWYSFGAHCSGSLHGEETVTHWMQLPDGPA